MLVLILILLHAPDGQAVMINPQAVTSLRGGSGKGQHFPDEAHCLINLSDGKFVTVREFCDDVKQKLEQAR